MQNADIQYNILLAFLIVFICLFSAGLIVYTVFFAIHKIYFRKQIALVKKYNELLNGLNSINIFKIQVLAKNDIGNKLELDKYIVLYKQLKDSSLLIRKNISIAEIELNTFNLKIAKKYLYSIDKDLNKSLASLNELKTVYDNYTQYGTAIHETFQNYLEIYEYLHIFYEEKLAYHSNFTKINALFSSIRKTFESIPKLANKFDYRTTISTVVDLGHKLKTLASIVFAVYRFQVIDSYLKTSRDYNDKMIANHYDEIDTGDLQSLQNLLTVFAHTYKNFSTHYKNLELGKAQTFAIQAINVINQINQFAYVHISTPSMINLSINEIKEQSDKILLHKNEIINSMKDLKQYFVLEPQIIDSFNIIEKDVNKIASLNLEANNINSTTHTEKINAIRELSEIGNEIVIKKKEIIDSIDSINDVLAKVIKTITDLNDFYIYFWQLLSLLKQLAPEGGKESDAIKDLIKTNLKQIEQYSKDIVSKEKPDFDAIAYELSSFVEQSNQIYNQITTTYMLKAYANKLFTYANRYKSFKQLKDNFPEATKLFKAKKYDECIDVLLKIIKTAKKLKKHEK